MIKYAIVLHLVWGLAMIYDVSATYPTATSNLSELFHSRQLAGAALIGAALLTELACNRFRSWPSLVTLLLMVPQQLLLVMSALGAADAVWHSRFADLEVRPRPFIFVDQFPAILAALTHSGAMVDHYAPRFAFWRRKSL